MAGNGDRYKENSKWRPQVNAHQGQCRVCRLAAPGLLLLHSLQTTAAAGAVTKPQPQMICLTRTLCFYTLLMLCLRKVAKSQECIFFFFELKLDNCLDWKLPEGWLNPLTFFPKVHSIFLKGFVVVFPQRIA